MKKQIISLLTSLTAAFSVFSPAVTGAPLEAAAVDTSKSKPVVVVSLGDSYSSGEGVLPFFGQLDENDNENGRDYEKKCNDWLAHRSLYSWPAHIEIPGIDGIMLDYKADGEYSTDSDVCKWYFRASSGAVTDDYRGEQLKETKDDFFQEKEAHHLPPQLDVFDTIKAKGETVDYVTMSIGGNDVGFADIIAARALSSAFLAPGSLWLTSQINDIWSNWDNKYGKNIKDAYLKAYEEAGEQAYIIIAGYPQLLNQDLTGYNLAEIDTAMIRSSIILFNYKLQKLVDECNKENKTDHFVFVDVQDIFAGHEAYSGKYKDSFLPSEPESPDGPWINGVFIGATTEDLDLTGFTSAFSMHPNFYGVQAYAERVNEAIADIENKKDREREALDESAEGFEWVVYPEIRAGDIIVGDRFMTNDYTFGSGAKSAPLVYIKQNVSDGIYSYFESAVTNALNVMNNRTSNANGRYGLISYSGKIAVPPVYDGFNGDRAHDYGLDEFIAVYDNKSGKTVFLDKGSGKESYSLREADKAFGQPGIGSYASSYFISKDDKKLYSFNGIGGVTALSGGDSSYIVQTLAHFDPDNAASLDKTVADEKFYLCDGDGNELTDHYRYAYCNGSGCVSGKVYTTCAFSNDGDEWDIFDKDGNKIISGVGVFGCNTFVDAWWCPVSCMTGQMKWETFFGISAPFCATEGYLAVKDSNGDCYYLNLSDNSTIDAGFEDIRPVHNGKAWVKLNGCWGVIALDGAVSPDTGTDGNIFQELPEQFVFSSGAGGWGTNLSINADGTFTGEYYDSDLGVTGPGYKNGTVYICNFSGKFSEAERIDEYTYSMKLEHIESEGTKGESYIKDDIKYIYSEPYGLTNGNEFLIYLPGTPSESMSEDFKSWLIPFSSVMDSDALAENIYGIYNIADKTGFVGKK